MSNLDELKQSLENLDPVYDELEKKYGAKGAEKIMSTPAMIHMLGTKEPSFILKMAAKLAIFNGVKPINS